jgi:DNA-directed RNA polymerase sigma subunit (sigma70/sigma32)
MKHNSTECRKRSRSVETRFYSHVVAKVSASLFMVTMIHCVSKFTSSVEAFSVIPSPLQILHYGTHITTATHCPSHTIRGRSCSSTQLATTGTNIKSTPQYLRRLPVEEQQSLFRHIMEVRRIRQIEQELTPHTSATGGPFQNQLARATGFGTNVWELEQAIAAGEYARGQLITTNMGLVHYCVNDFLKYHAKLRFVTVDDLIQEGAIGLARAVDRYNPSYHDPNSLIRPTTSSSASTSSTLPTAKFSTYAVYWIRAAILRCIAERDDVMRVPEHVSTAVRKISKAAHTLGLSLDNDFDDHLNDDSTIIVDHSVWSSSSSSSSSSSVLLSKDKMQTRKMLAEQTGLSDRMLQNAMIVRSRRKRHDTSILSYESWMQHGQNYETDLQQPLEAVGESGGGGTAASILSSDNRQHMKQTLSRYLRPKEMEALSWRYGLHETNAIRVGGVADVVSKTTTEAPPYSNPLSKRNYVADAELELFGNTSRPPLKDTTIHPTRLSTQQEQEQQHSSSRTVTKGKWGEAMSFTEVGKQMQVSAEYGRRLCHAALNKLRRAVEDGTLEPALLI